MPYSRSSRNPQRFVNLFLFLALLFVNLVTALPVKGENHAAVDYNDLSPYTTHHDTGARFGTAHSYGRLFGIVRGNNYPTAHGIGDRKFLSLLSTETGTSSSVTESHHGDDFTHIGKRLIHEWHHQNAPPQPPPPFVITPQMQKKIDHYEGKAVTHNNKAMYHFEKMLAYDAAHPKYQHHSQKMDAHLATAGKHAAVADDIRQHGM